MEFAPNVFINHQPINAQIGFYRIVKTKTKNQSIFSFLLCFLFVFLIYCQRNKLDSPNGCMFFMKNVLQNMNKWKEAF